MTVTIRPAAVSDLAEAQAWYEAQRPGLGSEFLAAVATALRRLESHPERFPIYHRDFRRVLVVRFPYKLFFRVQGETVIVFRLLHAASDHPRRLGGS